MSNERPSETRVLFDRLRAAESPPPERVETFRERLAVRRLRTRERPPTWSVVIPTAMAACLALALLLTRTSATIEGPATMRQVVGVAPPAVNAPPSEIRPPPTPREDQPGAIVTQDAGVVQLSASTTGTLHLSTIPASRCTIVETGMRHSTPWRVVLPPGTYSVRCSNDALALQASFSVTVRAGETVRELDRRID